jgi:hypothetical protein
MFTMSGCAYQSYLIPKDSYTLPNRFYTFAIYNEAGRLLSHPLLDLERTLKSLEIAKDDSALGQGCRNRKITDVYVISHGWNFSDGEAVANYHSYIENLDKFIKKRDENPGAFEEFCPYLILVTWTSTTRPVEDLTSGILPFNLADGIQPAAYFTDRFILHLLTAWKQSFRASTIALGGNFPDSYLYRSWYRSDAKGREVKEYGAESSYFGDKDTGYDAPLSALLYELIRWKTNAGTSTQSLPEFNTPLDANIHLVGHSYGGKLVALAGMEALRRWVLIDHLFHDKFKDSKFTGIKRTQTSNQVDADVRHKNLDDLKDAITHRIRNARNRQLSRLKQESLGPDVSDLWEEILHETGHGTGTFWPIPLELGKGPDEIQACKTIEKAISRSDAACTGSASDDSSKTIFPISSLILISPAMHPGELWYSVNWNHIAPASTLRLIPRKAILYSKYDYMNGMFFNIREALADVQGSQKGQVLLDDLTSHVVAKEDSWLLRMPVTTAMGVVNGLSVLGYSVLHGSLLYIGTTAINIPLDLWYHIQNNSPQSEWMPEWLKWDAPNDRLSVGSLAGRVANLIDFFIPLIPFGPSRDEDRQGIFRLSRPALGKTGVAKLAAGRLERPNLYGLQNFYSSGHPTDIAANTVCSYLARSYDETLYNSKSELDLSKLRTAIFSFDTSKIYNGPWYDLPVGAHDDVRSRDNETSCPSGTLKKEKREHSFDFVYFFTKGHLDGDLLNNLSKESK